MIEVDCFQAGIVKGLIEAKDATRHFGSLLGFQHHLAVAVELGLVEISAKGKRKPTALAKRWYKHADMESLPVCRAYYWNAAIRPVNWIQTYEQAKAAQRPSKRA